MGNQVLDPFARTTRAELKKNKIWRGEYLTQADEFQMKDLMEQLSVQRNVEIAFLPRKKKRAKREGSHAPNQHNQQLLQKQTAGGLAPTKQIYQPILSNPGIPHAG